jgi:hypothetical protein
MGDVDVKSVKNIDPIVIKEIDAVKNIEPLQIAKIAPAAIHVKELNQIDPITVDSLRVDEVRNLEPVKINQFDVTTLPTVNLSLGEVPALDLNLRRIPPLAVGVHQHFVLPSEYLIRARFLGLEVLRLHVSGQTTIHPHENARREVSATHERSYREVAAVGNPCIPVECREERVEAIVRERPRPKLHRARHRHVRGQELSVGAPPSAFPLARAVESSVGSA